MHTILNITVSIIDYMLMVCLLLPQRLSSTWQAAMEARSTPTTTPTTALCPHQTWTNPIASSSTIRADAHWVSPLTTWCWSFTRKMGMMPSAHFCYPPLTLLQSLSFHPRLFSGNRYWILIFEESSVCTLRSSDLKFSFGWVRSLHKQHRNQFLVKYLISP